ncbi:MAG TPA: helix-turn-helix transcriptional regulator [Bryobacteraceae bacterium]|nr:helix-turn-helix transcriptional regulator [Bryobacteraceae bacterium]
MNDLLVRLGKRIQGLPSAKTWLQEEFAHVTGFHRTYVGQIERGEKNISFGNLLKISNVFGVTLSELFEGLEAGGPLKAAAAPPGLGRDHSAHRIFEIQKLARRAEAPAGCLGTDDFAAGRSR